MKTKYILIVLSAFFCLLSTSCDDYLDKIPDQRAEIDTAKKINKLLTTAYSNSNISVLAELSSDNFVDIRAEVADANLSSVERMHDEIFAWEAAVSSTSYDSPTVVWQQYYKAIAVANHALRAIEELEDKGSREDFSALRGEALICRAYGHFMLVNMFCQAYKDEQKSADDLGIPYVTEPETVVFGDYSRGSVADVYNKIEKDIEDGINLISDEGYEVPKYRFNRKAANAFAARFYLYKRDYDKVIKHADIVLGTDPTSSMRNWDKKYSNMNEMGYDYISAQETANLMLVTTNSVMFRTITSRYQHYGDALKGGLHSIIPTWEYAPNGIDRYSFCPAFSGKIWGYGTVDYNVVFPKNLEMFEYTDKLVGAGYAHVVRAEFTVEETLLCRAEAYVMQNEYKEALKDLQIWNKSHMATLELTDGIIRNFYSSAQNNPIYVKEINPQGISPSFVVADNQLPYINCILHFRRMETLYDGYRWFDIKRYGIEIEHTIAGRGTDKLLIDDVRRAIQLPAEVIAAGVKENPISKIQDNNIDESQLSQMSVYKED